MIKIPGAVRHGKVVRSPFKEFFDHLLEFIDPDGYMTVYRWAERTCGRPVHLPMVHVITSYNKLKRRRRETYFGFYRAQVLLTEKQFVLFRLSFDQENVQKENSVHRETI